MTWKQQAKLLCGDAYHAKQSLAAALSQKHVQHALNGHAQTCYVANYLCASTNRTWTSQVNPTEHQPKTLLSGAGGFGRGDSQQHAPMTTGTGPSGELQMRVDNRGARIFRGAVVRQSHSRLYIALAAFSRQRFPAPPFSTPLLSSPKDVCALHVALRHAELVQRLISLLRVSLRPSRVRFCLVSTGLGISPLDNNAWAKKVLKAFPEKLALGRESSGGSEQDPQSICHASACLHTHIPGSVMMHLPGSVMMHLRALVGVVMQARKT